MTTIWKAILHMTAWGILGGVGLGILYGFGFVIIIGGPDGFGAALIFGTLYGAVFGGIVGAAMGVASGIILGGLTYVFFYPLTDLQKYRWTVCIVSALVVLFGGLIGFALLLPNGGVFFMVIPSLIASAAAAYAADRFALRYAADKRIEEKRKNDDKPKRDEAYV